MNGQLYHYTMCGLENVYLENGFDIHETDYGRGVAIHRANMLDAAIANAVVRNTAPLTGKEFRFLRGQLDKTQLEMAGLLGYDTQTVARWEKGEHPVNPAADRLMRVLYLEASRQDTSHISQFMWRLSEDNQKRCARLVLKAAENGDWVQVAA